jgi:hypothetical protein
MTAPMTEREALPDMAKIGKWNADEWHLFLCHYCDNRATFPNGLATVALLIADCMDALRTDVAQAQDDRPVEVWNGERKVTVYSDIVLCAWGPDMKSDMSEAPRSHESVGEAFKWLFTEDAQAPRTPLDLSPAELDGLATEAFRNAAQNSGTAEPVMWVCLVPGPAPAGAEMRIRAWTSDRKRMESLRAEGLDMQALFTSPVPSTPSEPAQSAPDGWKLVPIEPTPAMHEAGYSVSLGPPEPMMADFVKFNAKIYKAMIESAPLMSSTLHSANRNWIEDASHENGNYECRCCECGHIFTGHKRRVLCKFCSNLLAPSDASTDQREGGK